MTPHRRGRLLIVEDDPGVLHLERSRLEELGYAVETAATPEEARQRLRAERFDLLLLEQQLPGQVEGLSLYEEARQAGRDLPVILVSGSSDEKTAVRALRAGVRDFISKSPEFLDYLPEAVERVLRQAETERRLAESEAQLAAVIASARDAIIAATEDRLISLFNPAAERMFRCPAAEARGQLLSRFIPFEYAAPEGASTAESLTLVLRAGKVGVRADGEHFPLEASVARTVSGGRKLYTVIVRDESERRRAEDRLREQAAMLEQANDAIYLCGEGDVIRYWNRGAERLYGWSAAEAVGRTPQELLYGARPPEWDAAFRELHAHGTWAGEVQPRRKDGSRLVVYSTWTLIRDDEGRPRGRLAIGADLTDRKRLEAQLLHAQRLEAIGLLAGGVAHDFNNLLTVILGFSEMLLLQGGPEGAARDSVLEIRKAGERAASLTRQLLAFSRKSMLAPRVLDLNALVADTEKMLRRLIGEDIDLKTLLAPGLGAVRADPGQVEQVVVNLVVNARDAMPTGGHLTIETRNVDLDAAYAQLHAEVAPGPYVLLAVTDTGCGMDEATREQIFQPFFTTKEVGKGTGLGLASVYGTVKQSGGFIEVYSEPGRGSAFKIYLPRVTETAAVPAPPAYARGGTETVLVAEDEEAVRSLVRVTLEAYGYTVLTTPDGEEAARAADALPDPLHLLVTDVVMPRMSGRQLADRLAERHPGVKVLYLSGYTQDAMTRHGVLGVGVHFLEKPFAPTALARKVREVLDRS